MSKNITIEEKIYQKLMLLQTDDEFMGAVLAIKKKCDDSTEAIELTNNDYDFISFYAESDDYTKDIHKLLNKYGLTHIYFHQLLNLIHHGNPIPFHKFAKNLSKEPVAKLIPEIKDPIFYTDEITGEDKIHYPDNWGAEQFVAIELFPETTLKDIIKNWDKIAKERDSLYGIKNKAKKRIARRSKIERDLFIFQLQKDGKTARQIVRIVAQSKEFKGEIIGYEEVPKIILRLKQEAKRNIPDKVT